MAKKDPLKKYKSWSKTKAAAQAKKSAGIHNRIKSAAKPGSLHRAAKVPHGQSIPLSKLRALAKGNGKIAKKARMVMNMRKSLNRSTLSASQRMKKAWIMRRKLYGPKGKKR